MRGDSGGRKVRLKRQAVPRGCRAFFVGHRRVRMLSPVQCTVIGVLSKRKASLCYKDLCIAAKWRKDRKGNSEDRDSRR